MTKEERLIKIVGIASDALADVKNKFGRNTIDHAVKVALNSTTEDEFVVSMLHDVIEDTDLTLEDLKDDLTPEELTALDHITRRDGENYFDYIRRVSENELATKVKLLDLRDNMDLTYYDEVKEEHLSLLNRYLKAYKMLKKDEDENQLG